MTLKVNYQLARESHLSSIDVEIPNKGVTAIFGPSGVGKTTLLRVIAGLENVSGAKVIFNHQVWQNDEHFVPVHKRNIGFIFQHPSLFEHLSVAQNIQYAQQRAHQPLPQLSSLLEILELPRLMHRTPLSLSGGEQQRVAIARALAANPVLLLMDEPLASLDMGFKQEFLSFFAQLITQIDLPVLYVTHAADEVARLSDQLILLRGDGSLEQGSTHALLTDLTLPFATQQGAKAIIEGAVIGFDTDTHIASLETPCGIVLVNQSLQLGQSHKLVIHASDVSIALTESPYSSILNKLPATVVDYNLSGEGRVTLKLQVGESVMLSQITLKSFQELNLSSGKSVIVQIKSVALV